MDLELAGKTAIVTGGSRGIGKAIARELAAEGVDVAIVARSADDLKATAAELAEATGRRIVPIVADTADDASVKAMVEQAAAALGHLDILVNCAAQPGGQAPPPKLADITDDLFWSDVNVKVMGYLRCAREVAPHMISQRWGRIINVSGLAARNTGSTVGSIRNVAVVALTKNLAEELGPHGHQRQRRPPGADAHRENGRRALPTAPSGRASAEAEAEQRMVSNLVGRWIDATRDRLRRDVPGLTQGRRHQRRRDRRRRRRARLDLLLELLTPTRRARRPLAGARARPRSGAAAAARAAPA